MAPQSPTWIVLAGGRGARMGGPKLELELDGRRLVDHVVDAIPGGDLVIVVGPVGGFARQVRTCIEVPRFGGPVAALESALPLTRTVDFLLIGADMPAVVPTAIELASLTLDADVLLAVDGDGRRQPMCARWRTEAARTAIASLPTATGASLRTLLDLVTVHEVTATDPAGLRDIDTPEDLAAARSAREGHAAGPC